MRVLGVDEKEPVEHLVEDCGWNGSEIEVVRPLVDCMSVRGGVIQTVERAFGSLWGRDGETECSAHQDVDESP